MRIAIASDHRGLKFKRIIKKHLEEKGIKVKDFGPDNEGTCDYPDYARPAVESVLRDESNSAVLICASGIGMTIVANKFKGIRGALCLNPEMAKMAREHNNANVLILAANFTPQKDLKQILDNWILTSFEGGRHERRLGKITAIEQI